MPIHTHTVHVPPAAPATSTYHTHASRCETRRHACQQTQCKQYKTSTFYCGIVPHTKAKDHSIVRNAKWSPLETRLHSVRSLVQRFQERIDRSQPRTATSPRTTHDTGADATSGPPSSPLAAPTASIDAATSNHGNLQPNPSPPLSPPSPDSSSDPNTRSSSPDSGTVKSFASSRIGELEAENRRLREAMEVMGRINENVWGNLKETLVERNKLQKLGS